MKQRASVQGGWGVMELCFAFDASIGDVSSDCFNLPRGASLPNAWVGGLIQASSA